MHQPYRTGPDGRMCPGKNAHIAVLSSGDGSKSLGGLLQCNGRELCLGEMPDANPMTGSKRFFGPETRWVGCTETDKVARPRISSFAKSAYLSECPFYWR